MRIGSNDGIWEEYTILFVYDSGKPLKIDLMDDTVSWWYDSKVLESGFTPLEEGESLLVPNEFELLIFIF